MRYISSEYDFLCLLNAWNVEQYFWNCGLVKRDKLIKCVGDLLLLAFEVRVGSNIGDGISISGNDSYCFLARL